MPPLDNQCDRKCSILVLALGQYPACTETSIQRLVAIMDGLNAFLPGIREYLDCDGTIDPMHDMMVQTLKPFDAPDASQFSNDSDLYASFMKKKSSCSECINLVKIAQELCQDTCDGLIRHNCLEESRVHRMGTWMKRLLQILTDTRKQSEVRFWEILDEDPVRCKNILNALVSSVGGILVSPDFTKIQPICREHFRRIHSTGWMNDEIINYFIMKWTKSSNPKLLAFNSFYAGHILYEDKDCTTVRKEVDDVLKAKACRWTSRTKEDLELTSFDKVFIPINSKEHWFSALIDYKRKRIEIYDSLRSVYDLNVLKPIEKQRNSPLMLILLWLAEVLGSLRDGEPTVLIDNNSGWTWNPHVKVPFQANGDDCGLYMLWQLKHILELGAVENNMTSLPLALQVTASMLNKRLSLVQELLDNCDYNLLGEQL